MKDIVNKIIDIDRRADERLSEARKKKEEMLFSISDECERIKKKLSEDADRRIAEVRRINNAELEESSARLEKECKVEITEMDSFYEKNHVSIEEEIFKQTVGEMS